MVVFFSSSSSRPTACRRPCLASSLHLPLRAERGSGARGAAGDTRATRAARVHAGGSRRRSRAGAFARCAGLLLFLSSRPVCRSARAAPSLHPRAGGAHAHHEQAHGRTRRARRDARGEFILPQHWPVWDCFSIGRSGTAPALGLEATFHMRHVAFGYVAFGYAPRLCASAASLGFHNGRAKGAPHRGPAIATAARQGLLTESQQSLMHPTIHITRAPWLKND